LSLGVVSVKHRNNHLLVGYWQRLRQGRDVPDQTDIDPRAIKRILPYVFILDVTDADRPLYRLAGTAQCDQHGRELKGSSFLERWEVQSRGALALLLRQSLRTKFPVCLSSIASCESSTMIEVESVLAPITFIRDEPTRFIGMSQILSDPLTRGYGPILFERLLASVLISEDAPIVANDPPASAVVVRKPARGAHLRLVVDRDREATAFDAAQLRARDDALNREQSGAKA